MAMPIQQRGLYAYSIHGRDRSGIIDYDEFLRALSRTSPADRQVDVRQEIVALPRIDEVGSLWRLRFVAGNEGGPTQSFLDINTGEESTAAGPIGSIPVRPTTAYIHPGRRFVVIERRRPGLGPTDIAHALGALGDAVGFSTDLVLSLNPVTASSFLHELEEMERIRQASVAVARPNFDWTDNAVKLLEYAGESNGQTAEVEITAGRGGSLSDAHGIVADIKTLAAQPISPLKSVRIVGTFGSESKERTVRLSKHQERQYAEIDTSAPVGDQDTAVATAAAELIERLPAEDGDTMET